MEIRRARCIDARAPFAEGTYAQRSEMVLYAWGRAFDLCQFTFWDEPWRRAASCVYKVGDPSRDAAADACAVYVKLDGSGPSRRRLRTAPVARGARYLAVR